MRRHCQSVCPSFATDTGATDIGSAVSDRHYLHGAVAVRLQPPQAVLVTFFSFTHCEAHVASLPHLRLQCMRQGHCVVVHEQIWAHEESGNGCVHPWAAQLARAWLQRSAHE